MIRRTGFPPPLSFFPAISYLFFLYGILSCFILYFLVTGGWNIWLAVQFQFGASGDFGREELVVLLHRLLGIWAVQLHSPFQNVSVSTALETFTGFPFPVLLSFIFSPSFDCRIERLEFPKLQSYSVYEIKLKFGHQNITHNVQS